MQKKGVLTILVVFGFLATVFFLFMLAALGGADSGLGLTGKGLGVVEILGPIMDSKKAVEQIDRFAKNDNIKGIILRIDSPGGTVAGTLHPINQLRLAVGLKELNRQPGSHGTLGHRSLDIGQRLGAIDVGFPGAQQVQVGPVQDQN